MFAEIAMARIATAPDAADDLECTECEIEMLYPKYIDETDTTPVLTPTGADNVTCIWTWGETATSGTKVVVGRLVTGDWIIIAEACE